MSGVTQWNGPQMSARIRAATMAGVVRWIGDVEHRAVRLIMEPPKTGRIYRKRGVAHQASAGGEAPANETGRLVNSRRIDLFSEQLRARLNFSVNYALMLELGTKHMEPRPFARRALAESMETGPEFIRQEIRAALK